MRPQVPIRSPRCDEISTMKSDSSRLDRQPRLPIFSRSPTSHGHAGAPARLPCAPAPSAVRRSGPPSKEHSPRVLTPLFPSGHRTCAPRISNGPVERPRGSKTGYCQLLHGHLDRRRWMGRELDRLGQAGRISSDWLWQPAYPSIEWRRATIPAAHRLTLPLVRTPAADRRRVDRVSRLLGAQPPALPGGARPVLAGRPAARYPGGPTAPGSSITTCRHARRSNQRRLVLQCLHRHAAYHVEPGRRAARVHADVLGQVRQTTLL